MVDNDSVWSYWRSRASGADRGTIVVLGSSRMQLGFEPNAWTQKLPQTRVVNLAINGTQPVASLEDLAADKAFKGTVLLEVPAEIVGWHLESQQGFVDYYHREWSSRKAPECMMKAFLQEHLVSISPGLVLGRLVSGFAQHRWPPPFHIQTRWDRSMHADYSIAPRANLGDLRAPTNGPIELTPTQLEMLHFLRQAIDGIRSNGGEVLLVRTPTSKFLREMEARLSPRQKYWDWFCAADGLRAVNFEDVPTMRAIVCPEGSHLDQNEASVFTAALADELVRRGLIQR